MNKKLLLLVLALAFAALPALASAGEYELHCEGAAECVGEITGGPFSMISDSGEVFTCSAVGGSIRFASTSTTGTVNLHLTGCREHATFFTFQCNSAGAAAGTTSLVGLTYHLINLVHGGTTPGVKFTNISATFECTGFSKKTFTGSLIGHLESASCNTATTTHSVNFEESAITGSQKYTQTTTTGAETDLITNNDAGGSYTTMAIISTWTIHWDHNVKITC